MTRAAYVVIGRATGCELPLEGRSVSSRHARLRWERGTLWLEDLGSSNGTFVDGERVEAPRAVQIGQDVRLGEEPLPWHDDRLRAFLRHGASDTIVAMPRFGRYRCPKCRALGLLPPGFKHGELACGACQAPLLFGDAARGSKAWLGSVALVVTVAAGAALAVLVLGRGAPSSSSPARVDGREITVPSDAPSAAPIAASRTVGAPSDEERIVRESGTAARIMGAIDADAATTRNFAVQVAAATEGPFHVEQVVAIWMRVRAEFDYVNDPRGAEYFARASETIGNGFAGDCDDFATTLAASVGAIGGRARVVMMDGPEGGHAYAEACVGDTPTEVANRLRKHVRRHWNRRLGRMPTVPRIHHRSDPSCPVWLNLDWSANHPGGPYGAERWAVAIEADGATETLTPATGESSRTTPLAAPSTARTDRP